MTHPSCWETSPPDPRASPSTPTCSAQVQHFPFGRLPLPSHLYWYPHLSENSVMQACCSYLHHSVRTLFGYRIYGRIYGHTVLKYMEYGQKRPILAQNTKYTTEYSPYAEWLNLYGAHDAAAASGNPRGLCRGRLHSRLQSDKVSRDHNI